MFFSLGKVFFRPGMLLLSLYLFLPSLVFSVGRSSFDSCDRAFARVASAIDREKGRELVKASALRRPIRSPHLQTDSLVDSPIFIPPQNQFSWQLWLEAISEKGASLTTLDRLVTPLISELKVADRVFLQTQIARMYPVADKMKPVDHLQNLAPRRCFDYLLSRLDPWLPLFKAARSVSEIPIIYDRLIKQSQEILGVAEYSKQDVNQILGFLQRTLRWHLALRKIGVEAIRSSDLSPLLNWLRPFLKRASRGTFKERFLTEVQRDSRQVFREKSGLPAVVLAGSVPLGRAQTVQDFLRFSDIDLAFYNWPFDSIRLGYDFLEDDEHFRTTWQRALFRWFPFHPLEIFDLPQAVNPEGLVHHWQDLATFHKTSHAIFIVTEDSVNLAIFDGDQSFEIYPWEIDPEPKSDPVDDLPCRENGFCWP